MVADVTIHGKRCSNAKAIQAFPEHFRGQHSANLVKASRWWQQRHQFKGDVGEVNQFSCSRSRLSKRKRHSPKAKSGRGRKRSEWVQYLYPKLVEEFNRLKKSSVKFSSQLLRELAISILVAPNSIFTANSVDPKDNVLLITKITHSWMNQFIDSHNIVFLSQRGRLTCSPKKELQIEMETAYHLGILQRGFASGEFDENLMENLDETHFIVNLDNGHTLGFRGDTTMKYVEVVSGGESMTIVVRISGGRRATIEAPMIIFSNENKSYPIRSLIDDIPGFSTEQGSKGGWIKWFFLNTFWSLVHIKPIFITAKRSYGLIIVVAML